MQHRAQSEGERADPSWAGMFVGELQLSAKTGHLLLLLGCTWKKEQKLTVQRLTADRVLGKRSAARGSQVPGESRT